MKGFFLLVTVILLHGPVSAQQRSYLSLELGGSGGLASLNYEKEILTFKSISINLRAGFSMAPVDRNNGNVLVFPLMLHGIWGTGADKLDIGMGQSLSLTTRGRMFMRMPLSFGYRRESPVKRHYFRVSYTPIVTWIFDFQWEHWFGITYGIKLKRP